MRRSRRSDDGGFPGGRSRPVGQGPHRGECFSFGVMLGFVFIAGPRADSCAWPLVASRVCRPFVFHVEYLSRVCFAEKPPGNVLTFPRLPAPISVRVPPPPPPPPVPTLDPRTHAQGDVQRDNRVRGTTARRQIVRIQLRRFACGIGQEGGDDEKEDGNDEDDNR